MRIDSLEMIAQLLPMGICAYKMTARVLAKSSHLLEMETHPLGKTI
jgi:hypothetical protein